MGSSRMLRSLLQQEFSIFYRLTSEEEILEIEEFECFYTEYDNPHRIPGDLPTKSVPNFYFASAFSRPLKIRLSSLN
jgi:hypothetical protein